MPRLAYFVIALFSLPILTSVRADQNVRTDTLHQIFKPFASRLQKAKNGNIRLPSFRKGRFPDGLCLDKPITKIEQDGYFVGFSTEPDCHGSTYCRAGVMYGRKSSKSFQRTRRIEAKKITLKGGLRGYYRPSTFVTYFNDATIEWTQGGYDYGVGIKGAERAEIIAFANSVIEAPTYKIKSAK